MQPFDHKIAENGNLIFARVLNLDVSLHTLLQILSVTVFEKIELTQAVADSAFDQIQTMFDNQLNLLDS